MRWKPMMGSMLMAMTILMMIGSIPARGTCVPDSATPASPVPEDRWLPDFRPADPTDHALPLDRDSTDYNGLTIPGCSSGHELFRDVDVMDGHLFVAYNAGLQVWRIGPDQAGIPQRLAVADGFGGGCPGFLSFPVFGEVDDFINDIEVVRGIGDNLLIALSGRSPAGFSLWRFRTTDSDLHQLYQDPTRASRNVDIRSFGGTVYAFSASDDGVQVYDASAALANYDATGCLDDTGTGCSNTWKGSVGAMSTGVWVDGIEAFPGRLHLVASNGLGSDPMTLEIWEMTDPSLPGDAVQRFSGGSMSTRVQSPVFFGHEGRHYLALIEGISSSDLEIFDVESCLGVTAGDCSSLGTLDYSRAVSTNAATQKLTFSRSVTEAGTTPHLYYGGFTLGASYRELLLDLSELGTGAPVIPEVTDGGPTCFDPVSATEIDYWGWYDWFSGKRSQAGVFDGQYFYRTASSFLDVHVLGDPGLVFADGFESGNISRWETMP